MNIIKCKNCSRKVPIKQADEDGICNFCNENNQIDISDIKYQATDNSGCFSTLFGTIVSLALIFGVLYGLIKLIKYIWYL